MEKSSSNGSNGEFIVKFISESAKNGMTALDAAKKEIDEIDEKLHEAEKLKLRRMKLVLVLEHFGDESHRRRKASVLSEDAAKSSPEIFSELQEKILKALTKKPLNVGEIVIEVGSYDQDTLIVRALKSLGDQNLVVRNKQGLVELTKKTK